MTRIIILREEEMHNLFTKFTEYQERLESEIQGVGFMSNKTYLKTMKRLKTQLFSTLKKRDQ